MLYEMQLQPHPFAAIKSGKKDIEMRLNDEKRKKIAVGDVIRFTDAATGKTLVAVVLARHEYADFARLYAAFEKERLGYQEDEQANPSDMAQYYSDAEIAKYGVVGLEIQVI